MSLVSPVIHTLETVRIALKSTVFGLNQHPKPNKHLTLNGLQSFIWEQQGKLENFYQTGALNLIHSNGEKK